MDSSLRILFPSTYSKTTFSKEMSASLTARLRSRASGTELMSGLSAISSNMILMSVSESDISRHAEPRKFRGTDS